MLAGGAEAGVTPYCMASLDATRALSRRNDEPEVASRPFDVGRDGFVAAEGAAVVVLESLEHAVARGADVVCEVAGYGASSDAYHLTEPDPSGRWQVAAMGMALRNAGRDPLGGRLRQRPRHLDAGGRPGRDRGPAPASWATTARRAASRSAPPSPCTATAWARPAASRPC